MEYRRKYQRMLEQKIAFCRLQLREYQTRLGYLHPRHKLQEQRQYLADIEETLRERMNARIRDSRHQLQLYIERMKGLSPLQKLNQGYAYVADISGHTVKSITQVQPEDTLAVHVTDGVIQTKVVEIKEEQHDGDGTE
jgi:exodeoxyribonuclease VII large subunit